MPGGLPGLTDGGQEADTCTKVADNEPGVQTLAELAPIRKGGCGDLLAAEHVHDVHFPVCGR
jgi:hypothetical protein